MTFDRASALVAKTGWILERAMQAPNLEVKKFWANRAQMCDAILRVEEIPKPIKTQSQVLSDLGEDFKIEDSNGDFIFIGIRGEIGAFGWPVDEYVRKIDRAKTIQIGIRSGGGSINQALEVVAALGRAVERGATVETTVHDYALSAACLIAQAGTTRRMGENSFLMVHHPSTFTAGSAKELREQADRLEQIEERLINIYRRRTGQSWSTVAGWHDGKDHYFDSSESQRLNLIDEVINAEAVETPETFKKRVEIL